LFIHIVWAQHLGYPLYGSWVNNFLLFSEPLFAIGSDTIGYTLNNEISHHFFDHKMFSGFIDI
jgi:hypothetical protein